MRVMYRRTYGIWHGRDGFALRVADEWVPGIVAEKVVNGVLAALGHPCCGQGPLRRFGITHDALWRWGATYGQFDDEDRYMSRDEDVAGRFWFDVLNLPNRLMVRHRRIVSVPLTREQAIAIRPDVAGWGFANDDDSDDTDMTPEEFERLMDEGEPVELLTERPEGEA